MTVAPRCLICGAGDPKLRYEITRFHIVECRECATVYLDPLPSEEEIQSLFEELYRGGGGTLPELRGYYDYCYEDSPDNPLVQQYEYWLGRLERHCAPGRILDIGCGTGLFLSVARRRGWQPYGIDASLEATRHAREHFGLDPWVGMFEDFADQGEAFDVITGWDIIEHARAPLDLLRAAHRCLTPEGVLGLSTPNQHSILDLVAGALYRLSGGRLRSNLEKFYIDQHFLYFTPATLGGALARESLEVVEMEGEITDLRRLALSPLMRPIVWGLLNASKLIGLENRIFCIAKRATS